MRTAKGRIVLLSTGLTALALLAFSTSLYLWIGQAQRDALAEDVERRLHLFERVVHAETAASLPRALEIHAAAGGAAVRVLRSSGDVLYASPRSEDGDLEFRSKRVTDAAGEALDLRVGLSRRPVERTMRHLRIYFAVFVPAFVLLTAAAVRSGVRRLLAPIEDVRRSAERISRENVSERLPLDVLDGEFLSLAKTFNEMLDRLDRAMQDLRNFAADAAHELRTPIANLRAEIETAARHERTRDEHERILDSLGEEVSRMGRIVEDLLTLARLDLRQHALRKEPVSLRPLLEETRELWEDPAEARGIAIEVEGEDVEIQADTVALRRVFSNLVQNALQYGRDGDRIVLKAGRRGDRAEVRVEDNGPGIAAEHLPHLFRRFYRVDPARSRNTGGAGLGLAICKSFVEAHEGAISVESAAGRGTVFTIDLPARARPATEPVRAG